MRRYFCEKCGNEIKKTELPWCKGCKFEILQSRLKGRSESKSNKKMDEEKTTPDEETTEETTEEEVKEDE